MFILHVSFLPQVSPNQPDKHSHMCVLFFNLPLEEREMSLSALNDFFHSILFTTTKL